MRPLSRGAAALATVGVAVMTSLAIAEVVIEPPDGDQIVIELLSGIDFVPPRNSLDGALGAGAVDELIALARGDGAEADPGVRIRSYRALALYPGAPTRSALAAAIDEHAAFETGVDTVYARAAMDSLARIAGADAVAPLAPLLDHGSRDVRAAAADALAVAGAVAAVPALRARLQIEPVEQVRLALSAAIRALGD